MANPYGETEILIHIAAPATADDDVFYRQLASAYIEFEPRNRLALDRTAVDSVEPLLLESPDLSFASVLEGSPLPRIRPQSGKQSSVPSQASSQVGQPSQEWQEPPSEIPDSNPTNNVRISEYCSPKRVLQHYLRRVGHEISYGKDDEMSETSDVIIPVSSASSGQSAELPGNDTTGGTVVPCSQSGGSARTEMRFSQEDRDGRVHLVSSSINAEDVQSSSSQIPSSPLAQLGRPMKRQREDETEQVNTSSPFSFRRVREPIRADSEPLQRQRPPRAITSVQASMLERSVSDTGPTQEKLLPYILHFYEASEIRAPEPPVSCDTIDASSLVTQRLQKLARDLDMDLRYRPKPVARSLEPYERGYWLVDCSSWERRLRTNTWVFLANWIGSGLAGWGVRCRRDDTRDWIRVYCWAKIAGHIFLLLYLASERRLKCQGTSWIGADGEALIIVDPRH